MTRDAVAHATAHSTYKLVQEDKRPRCNVPDDGGHDRKVGRESALRKRGRLTRVEAGKDAIDDAHSRPRSGDEGANLGHVAQQSCGR